MAADFMEILVSDDSFSAVQSTNNPLNIQQPQVFK